MNKSDRIKIKETAQTILSIYQGIKKQHNKEDPFTMNFMTQGYRDSLEAMKRKGLIFDYNLDSGEITEALS